jgi:hypothetical protein
MNCGVIVMQIGKFGNNDFESSLVLFFKVRMKFSMIIKLIQ